MYPEGVVKGMIMVSLSTKARACAYSASNMVEFAEYRGCGSTEARGFPLSSPGVFKSSCPMLEYEDAIDGGAGPA